jgi:hypothetical protein
MPEDRLDPQTNNDENVENNEEAAQGGEERFVSDTQKIIHRHLSNKDDVITDEDIANVRVGMTPPILDEATEARFEDEDKVDNAEDDLLGNTGENEETDEENNSRITPWDTVDPEK